MSDFFALPPGHNTLAASTPATPRPLPAVSSSAHVAHAKPQPTIREILPTYLAYAEYEWRLAPKSIKDYKEGICRLLKVTGDITPQEVDEACLLSLKADFAECRIGPFWARSVLASVRSFLRFCKLVLGIEVLDADAIRLPRLPHREVVYLTPEEIEKFLSAIPVFNAKHRFNLRWLCFRALVEVLLATGMRITEALSLKRSSLNLVTGEAGIIGKGNRERTVFFTTRALAWVKEYFNQRHDDADWFFTLPDGRRVPYDTARCWFRKTRVRAGIVKKVTAHILRHTCATMLLFNGCPIGHIKEILGHDRLQTTCEYYLGVDKQAAKEAHQRYLKF